MLTYVCNDGGGVPFCSGTQCFLGMSEEAVSYLYFLISCLRDLKMHAQTHSATEIEKKGLFVKKKKKKEKHR